MFVYILKRLILAAGTLLVILALSYLLLRLAPGDPTKSSMFGTDGNAATLNAERADLSVNQSMRKELHLDEPLLTGFGYWLAKVVWHGDFGNSASVDPGRPVTAVIMARLPVTLTLNIWAILITYFIAVPLGIFTALRENSWWDKASGFALFFLYSLPGIWVGIVLQTLFCEGGRWPVFPLKGLFNGETSQLGTFELMWQTSLHYVLPVICLGYAGIAGLSRYTRSGMLEILQKEYIRTARAKGVSEPVLIVHHALRNALITLITLFSGLLPALVTGSIIVEYVFNIPGMGQLSLEALSSRDYPLQMALFAFAGSLTLAGILLSDLDYVLADPRISLSGKRSEI